MNINIIARNDCFACQSKDIEILKSVPFMSDIVFDFLKLSYGSNVQNLNLKDKNIAYSYCRNCSMVWQKYILNDEGLEYLYEKLVSAKSSLDKRENGSYTQFESYLEDVKRIKFFYPNNKPREIKVLDFGMGWGHYCIAANAVGFNTYGCELSEERIKYAKTKGVNIIKNTKEINDNFYDFINVEQVFEHLSNPVEILQELSRILKLGGILKISVPNSMHSIKNLRSGSWKPIKDSLEPLQHINSFTNQTLKTFALNNNFTNVTPTYNKGISFKNFIKEKIKSYFATSLYFKKIH